MKKIYITLKTFVVIAFMMLGKFASAQCYFSDSTDVADTVSFVAVNCSLQAYACADIAVNYWIDGTGKSVIVNFVHPQNNPSLRVWGMNTDDSATVTVNGTTFPVSAATASYDAKVVCGLSPGPDGIAFANGKIVGANSPQDGNYSYQNVTLNAMAVTQVVIAGAGGAGWGFAGVTIDCSTSHGDAIEQVANGTTDLLVYPNPASDRLVVHSSEFGVNTIDIIDLAGRKVWSSCMNYEPRTTNHELDISSLSTGIYFVRMIAADKISTVKLIVE